VPEFDLEDLRAELLQNKTLLHTGEIESSSDSDSEPSIDNLDERQLTKNLKPRKRKRKGNTKGKLPNFRSLQRVLNKNRSVPLLETDPSQYEESKQNSSIRPSPVQNPLSATLYASVGNLQTLSARSKPYIRKIGVRTWYHKGKKFHD
jgi:hypothetical protein